MPLFYGEKRSKIETTRSLIVMPLLCYSSTIKEQDYILSGIYRLKKDFLLLIFGFLGSWLFAAIKFESGELKR